MTTQESKSNNYYLLTRAEALLVSLYRDLSDKKQQKIDMIAQNL